MSDTEQQVVVQPTPTEDAGNAAAEAEFARLREERAARNSEATEAAVVAVEKPEVAADPVSATAQPAKPTASPPLTPAAQPDKDDPATLRAEIEKYKRERDAAVANVAPLQRQLSQLQQPARRQQEPSRQPRQQQRQVPAASILDSAETKQLVETVPELKPVLQVLDQVHKSNAELRTQNAQLAQRLDELNGFVGNDLAPRLHSFHEESERRQHEQRQHQLSSAFSDWSKHYAVEEVTLVNPETGKPEVGYIDGKLSPQFAAWLYTEHDAETQELKRARFSDDTEWVAEMWAKFAADTQQTTQAQPAASGAVEARQQRLASAAAPQMKPTPALVPVDESSMTDEQRFLHRRQLRKQGRL